MPGTRVRYEIINRLFRGRPATHGESALRLDTRNRLHTTGVLFRVTKCLWDFTAILKTGRIQVFEWHNKYR